ncbi:hypothetical protein IWX90DRAFT_300014 [Phyllosticta citrichinensis]|uniref:Fermentation associated protein n=1 Tax=Phyllosticta citrichinensis TaxID=1130410 RepID=A0ABR1XKQ0_9PEZI
MANNQLTSQPLGAHRGLLWQFLVECLVCGILTVFFLFYFNRLFATLVSYGIRAYTWHTFRAYIDIESLQISLLGGRLFWKDIRYHGHNQTILIHGGYLTWRFWYGRVKQTEIFDRGRVTPKPGQLHTSSTGDSASRERSHSEAKAEEGGKQKIKELPCRISIKVSGVEAFLYNRTPAYDSIVENFTRATGTAKSTPSPGCDVPVSQQSTYAPTTFSDKVQSVLHRRNTNSSKQKSTSRVGTAHGEPPKSPSEAGEVKKPPEIPSYLRLLPVRIDCNKAAVVMGNESTPSVLVAKCDKASGEITAAHAGPLDLYKQVFNLDFDKPTVHMKPNPDYKNPQLATAARLKRHGQDDAIPGISKKERRTSLWRRAFTPVQNLFYHFNSSQESLANSRKPTKNRAPPAQPPFPGQGRWQGLTRYLDDDDHNEHDEWDGVEYAKFSLIADCSRLSLSLYWDVPGIVPKLSTDFERQASFNTLDINGSLPPEYGLDLHVYEAMLHYGPWADRHRVILQNYFFPALFTDSMPAKPLAPGDTRVATVFKIFVSLEEQCVLRIPLREQSKDWKWKGRAHTVAGSSRNASSANGRTKSRKKYSRAANRDAGSTAQNVRPFGWLDIVVEANSTVNYIMDMVAGPQGFTNSLDVDLRGTESFSSVNHDLLWKSGPVEMDCNLSNPLKWNALRQWGFNMRFNDMDLFLLRDHMFLVTDLINDWGSGPPSEYYTFTPFKYFLNMDFQNLRLYLNTNDSNIINNPADLEDNHFILFHGKNLGVHLGIPLEKFQPIENCITFDARGDEISLDLSLPPGNTAASFLKDKHLADLKELTVLGSYDYFSETALGLTDRLHLDVRGSSLVLTMYGFLIKHFMTFKDNYFGEDMHFKTLEEFRELPQSNGAEAPPVNSAEQAASKSNDLDVILSIEANDSSVLLPANLYTAEDHTRVDVPFFHQDLRVTNYYMDLAMDFSPLSASLGVTNAKEGTGVDNSQTQLYVSMIKLHGHHTFGLPPAEPSYLCGWEFNIGSVTGECSAMLLDKFAGFGRCFAFCLDDDENALPLVNSAIIHDVNFFRIKTNAVSMWLHVAQEAFLIRADPISVDFNDWARSTFSQRLNVLIPNLVIACVDSRTASRQRNRSGTAKVEPQAYLQTDIRLSMLKRKLHFTDDRRAQQAHVKESDLRTHRAQWLLLDDMESFERPNPALRVDPPAMQSPFPPTPLNGRSTIRHGSISTESSTRSRPSKLSISTASIRQGSFAKPQSGMENLRRMASKSSLKQSIEAAQRPNSGNHRRNLSGDSNMTRPSIPERRLTSPYATPMSLTEGRDYFAPLKPSIALASSLETPYFPLHGVDFDTSEVPEFPQRLPHWGTHSKNAVVFNDVSNKTFDENFSHTSFLVSFEPGIRALITPNAVSTVVNLIDVLQPRHPRDILDDFQMTIMGKIMDLQNLIDGKGSSTECNLRLPSFQLRFVSSIPPLNGEKMNTGKDQYDLVLDHLAVSVRDKKWPKQEGDKSTLSLHTTLKSVSVSAREKHTDRTGNDVAVSAELTELLVWLVAGTSASVNVRFKDMDIATSSKHVQYLASLIHRTALLADEIGTKFAELVAKSQRRLRYLAYALTLAGKDIPDPAFITRPSYAIRAANSHLRNHDSWKIISRLHYVYDSLSSEVRQDIIDRCMRGHSMCPPDAENCVIAAWDQWRTWDLAHVRKSLAMRELYGSTPDFSDAQEKKPMRIDASFRTGAIRLIVDPGPEQSDVLFQLLSIDVALSPPAPPTGLMLHEAQRASVVEVSTKNVAITISWEICALVENVIRLFQSDAPQARRADKNDSLDISPHFEDTPVAHKFQVVFATDTGSIAIDTINLRYQSTINAMKLSVVGTDKTAMKEGVSVSALVHSNAAGSELRSRGRLLMRTQVVRPSIFVSHDDADWRQTTPEGWLIIGKSGELSIKVVEDVLGILEVANSVICDEVAYFAGQVESFKTTKVESPRTPEKKDTAILPNITVALLMDSYRIEIALLQSLSYVISGKIGRVSIAPLFDKDPTLTVNFDVDRQSHCLHNHKKRQSQIVAAFTLPLQNGTLTMVHSRTGLKIGFNCIMDTFIIEASAVHGLLLAINEPEVMNVLSTIKDDIEVLQTNAKEALPQTKPEKAPALEQKEDMSVAFDANFVMAGIGILARAPTKLPDSSNATIAFELNRIQVKATNIGPDNELLPLPEFSALLPHISLSCQLSDGDNIKDCGNLFFGLELRGTLQGGTWKIPKRNYRVRSTGLEVNIFADTASAAVEVLNHLQERIKGLDLSRERRYLRKLRQPRRRPSHKTLGDGNDTEEVDQMAASGLFTTAASLELSDIQISWIVGNSVSAYPGRERNDLVLSFKRIELATRSEETARLSIEDMQLQMVPTNQSKRIRSANSALLPEVVFNVSYISSSTERRFAFNAAGKSLDLRLDSKFTLPASILEESISLAGQKVQAATESWHTAAANITTTDGQGESQSAKKLIGNKRLSSLLVDADFAGAVVTLQGQAPVTSAAPRITGAGAGRSGRYGQFSNEGSNTSTTLRAPGVTLKVEYRDDSTDPSMNAELKVDASTNMLHPSVVPLIMDISNSVKEVVQHKDDNVPKRPRKPTEPKHPQKFLEDENLITADPSAILGKTRLNLGLRICKQEFSLSCQPIARVAATARFEDIYLTINSIKSTEQGHFFAVSATFDHLQASVQHVYSRESTFSFDVNRVVLSVMNSKHLSGTSGISAILKIDPMRTHINARQLQDFLLFREIWIPPEVRRASKPASPAPNEGPQEYLVQRYEQVTAAAAFPWNATVSIEELAVDLDLGQAIGKPSFKIVNLWASSKKTSDWEENLCIGMERISIDSTGRTSGFVELLDSKVRTSISWPSRGEGIRRSPHIQASLGFERLSLKTSFDYQPFAVADVTTFNFLMYNVRGPHIGARDRLVVMLEGEKVQAFITTTSAAQAIALSQAFDRLISENQTAYKQSIKDIERFLRRTSSSPPTPPEGSDSETPPKQDKDQEAKTPISLHTDVVVTLSSISFGAFPSAFSDHQILLLTASDVQARFAVGLEDFKVHSGLGMTLGELSVALASINHKGPQAVSDLTVEDVVANARAARGGTILRVPKVIAAMQTWQASGSNHIDYIFKSSFEGKVDVGWNYSRISFIRNMWNTHSRALANRLGKPLPESAVKITGGGLSDPAKSPTDPNAPALPSPLAVSSGAIDSPTKAPGGPEESTPASPSSADSNKITAVVNVPQSRYEYTALETPVIETPQLRDMGEATPPLEWIGLHRDRLPNVTHQIVIVTLLEIVKEVEDAYARILGST